MRDVGHRASVLRRLQRGSGPLLRDGVRGPSEMPRSEKNLILIEAEAGDSGLSCRSHFFPRLSGDLCVPLTLRGGDYYRRRAREHLFAFVTPHGGGNRRVCLLSAVCGGWGGSRAARGRVVRGREDFFLNGVVICDIPLTARRGPWPCFLLLGVDRDECA